MRRHQGDRKRFDELTFAEQAKSVTAQLNVVERAVRYHVRHAPDPAKAHRKCLDQLDRLRSRLQAI